MKTRERVTEEIQGGRKSGCEFIDSRDYARLTPYFQSAEGFDMLGFSLKEGAEFEESKAWTRENIIEDLKGDVSFAFEKANNQRGISANLMYEVVKMWMWVFDDELADYDDYYDYGIPFLKQVAAKYELPDESWN